MIREQRRLAAIVSADVAGYSRLMGRDESGTLAALKAMRREVVDPPINAHGGRIVKTTGDGLLLEFPSVVDAVHCVVEVQTAMAARGGDIAFRIGVNLGDIIIDGDDIFGDGVNVAARLQEIAAPGGVCVSQEVHSSIRNKVNVPFRDDGIRQLKNIGQPVRVYRWSPAGMATATAPDAATAVGQLPWLRWGAAISVVLVVGISVWRFYPGAASLVPGKLADAGPPKVMEASTARPSIAVLPFANQGGEPAEEYFSDGVTEDVIAALGRFSSLVVMAPNAVFPYKGKSAKPADVARDLGVRYLVEGNVRRAGDRVRVSARLIEASAGTLLWSEQFDEEIKDIFSVQETLAQRVAGTLVTNLNRLEQRRALAKPTQNLAAYDLVLRGRERLAHVSRRPTAEAEELFERATQVDPLYAAAWAWRADAMFMQVVLGWSAFPDDLLERAEEMARRAIDLDGQGIEGHRVLGRIYSMKFQYDRAMAQVDRALEINPSDAETLDIRGHVLLWSGKIDEAIGSMEAALKIDPNRPASMLFGLGLAYYEAHRHLDAVRILERAVSTTPDYLFAHVALAAAFGQLDRTADAARERMEVLRLNPFFDVTTFGSRFREAQHKSYVAQGLAKAGFR